MIPFQNGDHMDQKTFHRLYLQTPEGFKAELIGGIVYLASPTKFWHGEPHARAVHWLHTYKDQTEGLRVFDNATNILAEDSEPQPDVSLLINPECGGQTTFSDEGYVIGPAELVIEIALSSANIDLHAKKRDYEKAGVREYLVILVDSQSVAWFVRGKKGFTALKAGADGVYRSRVFPGLWLEVATMFEDSSRRMMEVLGKGLTSDEHATFVEKIAARAKKIKRRPPTENGSHAAD
ncbi:Uma2 family endonuclease [Fimbriiglobus ruber]|uniref:Uma2 family endonuclease n=1 Tax=Fimbriiglobus ruber TaxID=1908690 RepID=UPI00137A46F4|nr:Uma2 family endonuclease [Fimbriiglobus ruber]